MTKVPDPGADAEATARQDPGDVRYTPRQRTADVQFAPGTIIAGRYRIASILGSGGMGEVYRADDTKLDQPVALKFLPARLARDPMLLGRLHDEVRLGRQIAHPNVCRIYDIVDFDGAHFVSMEYVDGEDLSRLLRRIGRLAHDKAVDMARGIAAGLMAAHAKGILHRDLKPANIMIDSHGDARIMDFGLALGAGEDDGTISGTPAYMAPEQLSGTPATIQSDLYALGLVMYELFTGKRAHNARTMNDRVRDLSSEITTPSSVIRDIDPLVERVILRCLSNDPAHRPRSAREVIDALPGGDPLAAALAAGETPSPRLIAAAGAEGSLQPWQAWAMLGSIVALLALFMTLRAAVAVTRYTSLDLPPEVLWQRSTDILRSVGIQQDHRPVHQVFPNRRFMAWLLEQKDPKRWAALRDGPGVLSFRREYGPSPAISRLMPFETNSPTWTTIEVDPKGRLTYLLHAPRAQVSAKPFDWRLLHQAGGIDLSSLQLAPPRDLPVTAFDTRAAWTGRYTRDRTPLRIEAAAFQGQPVAFRVTGVWDESAAAVERTSWGGHDVYLFMLTVLLVLISAGLVLAWRNVRMRRGDRVGALRVATAVFALDLLADVLYEIANVGLAALPQRLGELVGDAAVSGLYLFVLYLALEPYARRRWPEQLIAWSRLIGGSPRDPLVGRHILIGIIGGIVHAFLANGAALVVAGFDTSRLGPMPFSLRSLSVTGALAEVSEVSASAIQMGCVYMIFLVLLTIVFRKKGIATAALFALSLFFYYLAIGNQPHLTWAYVCIAALQTFITVRWGALAIAAAQGTFFMLFDAPFAPGAAWMTPITAIPLLATMALAGWAFVTSLGGQSPFNAALLDE